MKGLLNNVKKKLHFLERSASLSAQPTFYDFWYLISIFHIWSIKKRFKNIFSFSSNFVLEAMECIDQFLRDYPYTKICTLSRWFDVEWRLRLTTFALPCSSGWLFTNQWALPLHKKKSTISIIKAIWWWSGHEWMFTHFMMLMKGEGLVNLCCWPLVQKLTK